MACLSWHPRWALWKAACGPEACESFESIAAVPAYRRACLCSRLPVGIHPCVKVLRLMPFPSPVLYSIPSPRVCVCVRAQVLKFQEAQSRVSASNDFFRGLSKEADLVMDGDLLMVRVGSCTVFIISCPATVSFACMACVDCWLNNVALLRRRFCTEEHVLSPLFHGFRVYNSVCACFFMKRDFVLNATSFFVYVCMCVQFFFVAGLRRLHCFLLSVCVRGRECKSHCHHAVVLSSPKNWASEGMAHRQVEGLWLDPSENDQEAYMLLSDCSPHGWWNSSWLRSLAKIKVMLPPSLPLQSENDKGRLHAGRLAVE